ncbi:MAG: protease complex subunit PrcB family protein [Bacillota bacterium]
MRRLTLLAFVVLLSISVVGCQVTDLDADATIYQTDQQLQGEWHEDSLPSEDEYQLITANNKEQLLQQWRNYHNRPYYSEIKKLDLDGKVAFLAYLGSMSSGGYGMQINKILQKDNKIIIRVKYISPDPEESVTSVITYPYDLVVVDRDKLAQLDTTNLKLIIVNQDGNVQQEQASLVN